MLGGTPVGSDPGSLLCRIQATAAICSLVPDNACYVVLVVVVVVIATPFHTIAPHLYIHISSSRWHPHSPSRRHIVTVRLLLVIILLLIIISTIVIMTCWHLCTTGQEEHGRRRCCAHIPKALAPRPVPPSARHSLPSRDRHLACLTWQTTRCAGLAERGGAAMAVESVGGCSSRSSSRSRRKRMKSGIRLPECSGLPSSDR